MSFVNKFQKAITYIREVQEIALYAVLINSAMYGSLGASSLFVLVFPFIAFLLTINALINVFYLVATNNKNVDHWLGVSASLIGTACSSVSLYGSALSILYGFSFPLAPWFFLAGLSVGVTQQLIMLGINLLRSYESVSGSVQRMHSIQASLNNLFALGLFGAALIAVVFLMIAPAVAPMIGAVSATMAIGFTLLNIFWRIFPESLKDSIKSTLGLAKPEERIEEKAQQVKDLKPLIEQNPNHHRLFSRFDHSIAIKEMSCDKAKIYLDKLIANKIHSFEKIITVDDSKTADKLAVLIIVKNAENFSKKELVSSYPLAFQSFWVEQGEVEQIVDAALAFRKHFESPQIACNYSRVCKATMEQ